MNTKSHTHVGAALAACMNPKSHRCFEALPCIDSAHWVGRDAISPNTLDDNQRRVTHQKNIGYSLEGSFHIAQL